MTDAALTLLGVVLPIFALILAGYVAAVTRWVDAAGFAGLNGFAFGLAAPALLFAGGTAGHGGGGAAALAFFLGVSTLYAVTLLLARSRLGLAQAGTLALNVTFGNSVMMGIPLIAAAYGQPGVAVLLGILALHSLVLLGTATVVAEVAQNPGARAGPLLRVTVGGVLRNPIVMAVMLALLWSWFGWPVPGWTRATLELLGAAAPPVSLFCLGGSLHGFDARGAARQTAVTVVLKLAVLPVLVWGFGAAMGLGRLEMAVAVTAAALPTGANAFLLARRYGVGSDASDPPVVKVRPKVKLP